MTLILTLNDPAIVSSIIEVFSLYLLTKAK